ncbi:hypothetical protein NQ315_002491 [Exocentrus adspersus]|uniref:Uncharacterized protein n=1 Tax=Exocentrus adspersus TaxID=1586481 RepID=A0AAV8VL68_9CUCU|nr:hypothetical protein NQ315_002491 [Exocentrus adspersus]
MYEATQIALLGILEWNRTNMLTQEQEKEEGGKKTGAGWDRIGLDRRGRNFEKTSYQSCTDRYYMVFVIFRQGCSYNRDQPSLQMFGIFGVLICTLHIKYVDDDDIKHTFFKLSMGFAVCNLLLSVILLVLILKRDQKYAFLYAFVIFISLFAATIHIEGNNTKNITFIIVSIVFAALCFMWFCAYGAYHYWLKETEETITQV